MDLNERKRKVACLVLALEEEESSDEENELVRLTRCRESNDEEIVIRILPAFRDKRNCIRKYDEDVVPTYTDEEFRTHFRVNVSLYKALAMRFEEHSIFYELRSDKRLSGSKCMLVFLWFAGHEACSFRDIGDRFDICIATVNRIINRVTTFLSEMAEEVITWPDRKRMEETVAYFEAKYGFPKTIGAIDGTHIVIDPPKDGKDDYIDRKGSTSIVLQAICDENKKFLDIFIGYPGSTHDSRVFRNSFIFPKLNSICQNYFIVGDSAYPLQQNLMKPYRDNGHLSSAQKHFNRKLSSCRVVIEHSFGLLKQRFRQLYYCKLRGMEKLCNFVKACCVLHNLAGEDGFPLESAEAVEDEPESYAYQNSSETLNLAKSCRDTICMQLQQSHQE